MKKRNFKNALLGYVGFFAMVAVTVTAAVLIYEMVATAYDGNKTAISLIMLVVCLGLTLLCTTVDALRRRFTVDSTVDEIVAATEMITRGNFNVRLKPKHRYNDFDDFDVIIDNLNRMAEELSRSEVLNSDFVSNVSHEIKTPLAIIQNYATALQSDKLTADERVSYLKTLVSASNRITQLVSNILKLNKLENQQLTVEMQPARLDEIVAQAVFDFEEVIEQKNINLQCDFDEVTVNTSASHLETVWNNLLSNAIKFTPEGGKITISVKQKRNKAVVTFSDSGCGMTEETGKRIFDKFYQGDTSHAKEGNGLGLALVKRVIDLLGGEISVESQLGQGSTFTVTLGGVTDER